MPRVKSERIDVRMTPMQLKNVQKIRDAGEFADDSEAVRFCIGFTATMMRILPAVLVESFVQTVENEEDITVLDAVSSGDSTDPDIPAP